MSFRKAASPGPICYSPTGRKLTFGLNRVKMIDYAENVYYGIKSSSRLPPPCGFRLLRLGNVTKASLKRASPSKVENGWKKQHRAAHDSSSWGGHKKLCGHRFKVTRWSPQGCSRGMIRPAARIALLNYADGKALHCSADRNNSGPRLFRPMQTSS
jgi:hypothetical protein